MSTSKHETFNTFLVSNEPKKMLQVIIKNNPIYFTIENNTIKITKLVGMKFTRVTYIIKQNFDFVHFLMTSSLFQNYPFYQKNNVIQKMFLCKNAVTNTNLDIYKIIKYISFTIIKMDYIYWFVNALARDICHIHT
jgi:hypothetical protein